MMSNTEHRQEPEKSNSRNKRLYRSRRERMIGGICGGAAAYFGIDATLLRVAFVVFAFMGGWGIIAYIVGLIIIPERPEEIGETQTEQESTGGNSGLIWGSVFIIAGLIFLLYNYGWLPWPMWRFWQLSWKFLWSFLIIFIGLVLLLSKTAQRGLGGEGDTTTQPETRRLTRSRKERMIGGVCGGIASYFRIDPTLVRLLWAFGTILSHGLGILAYIILLIVLQEGEEHTESAKSNSEVQQ